MAEVLAVRERHLARWAPVLAGQEADWEEVFAGYVGQARRGRRSSGERASGADYGL
jgi:hypothetical protein